MPLVSRPRIADAIERSASRGVALLVAPAGYGKTEAIEEIYGGIGRFVATEAVVDVASAARAIIAATIPDALRSLSQYLRRMSGAGDAEASLVAWLSRRLRSIDAPIVIDDLQRFANDIPIRNFLVSVIEATIPRIRWVLACRETPDLPMGSWISAQRMTLEVNAEDLAFTFAEARAMASSMSIDIDDGNLQQILDDADGWPLVIRLILEMWRRTPAIPPVRIRTRAPLFEFFRSELWEHLSLGDRELLLAASFCPHLTTDLLRGAALTESHEELEGLARRIPLLRRTTGGAYRLHDLFADFVRECFESEDALRSMMLAALTRSYVQLGEPATALQVAVRGEAPQLVIEHLGRIGASLIEDGYRASVAAAMKALPPAAGSDPIVAVMRGLLSRADGNIKAAEETLRSVDLTVLPLELARVAGLRRGQLALALGFPDRAIAELEPLLTDTDISTAAEAMVRTAAALAKSASHSASRSMLSRVLPLLDAVPIDSRALLYERIAFTYYYLSDYGEGERYALIAVEFAVQCDDNATLRSAYSTLLSLSQLLYADTAVTTSYAERWLDGARESGDAADLVKALASNIGLAAERGDVATYDALYAEFYRLRRPMLPDWQVQLRWTDVLVDVARGRTTRAAQQIAQMDKSAVSASEVDFLYALEGLLWAMAGDDARATVLANTSTLAAATHEYDAQHVLFAAAYRALTFWILGKQRKAQGALRDVPNSLPQNDIAILSAIRSICHCPPATMTQKKLTLLLGPLIAMGLDGHANFLRAVFKPNDSVLLTRTELDILRELRFGGSSEDIGLRLGRSPRTVESHINSVCRKLQCSGRTEALIYVMDQGWI